MARGRVRDFLNPRLIKSVASNGNAMVRRKTKNVYAVKRGRKTGVFQTWKECEKSVRLCRPPFARPTSRCGDAASDADTPSLIPLPRRPPPSASLSRARAQVKGYANALHKAFASQQEAEAWCSQREGDGPSTSGRTASQKPWKTRPTKDYQGIKYAIPKVRPIPPVAPRTYTRMQFDGGARGNPGVAGAGVVLLCPEGRPLWKKSVYLGNHVTNNQAEYEALLMGLRLGIAKGITKMEVQGDSNLVVHQVTGKWAVKDEALRLLMDKVAAAICEMDDIVIRHIPRELNKIADQLANDAMDTRQNVLYACKEGTVLRGFREGEGGKDGWAQDT